MVFISNQVQCSITPGANALSVMGCYSQQQYQRSNELNLATIAWMVAAAAQLVLYYDLLDEMIDKRDEYIDIQLDFIDELETLKDTQDFPMLDLKKDSVNLPLPDADVCVESERYIDESLNDGAAITETATRLSQQSCAGIPVGWGLHDGQLAGALSGPYAANLLAGNAKRRLEKFRKHKTDIVQSGQVGMKAVYNANDILAQYSQATAIYSGLSDLAIQGFNSAGAALGTALGQLSTATKNPVTDPKTSSGLSGPAAPQIVMEGP